MGEARHKRLYKNSPELKRGDDGHMGVTKKGDKQTHSEVEADKAQSGIDGMKTEMHPDEMRHAHERRELKHQHIHEHHAMHHKHEMEHTNHVGDKTELHARHLSELAELHKKHETEHKNMYKKHEKEMHSEEGKEMSIKEGHETKKDKVASEPKADKKE